MSRRYRFVNRTALNKQITYGVLTMDFSRVTKFLESLSNIGIPGADLAVYLKGKEVYRHQTGVTNVETKAPVKPDTLYPIYSMTKIITCVSAMQLFEQGVFSLSDPLYDYLPEFNEMTVQHIKDNDRVTIEAAKNPIRIVDLFTMSSGITYNMTPELVKMGEDKKGNFTLKELATALSKDTLFFEPGTHFNYGFSHDILGYMIEVVTGKTLGEYFNENIFIPLGMSDTFFKVPKEKEHRLITCYQYDETTKTYKEPFLPLPIRFDEDFKFECAGGGLVSTIDDYAIFANALCAGGTTACGHKIISKNTIELMRTNHLDDIRMKDYNWPHHSGYGYGLGVRTMVDKAAGGSNSNLGEFGWSGMAGTYVLIDP